MAIAPDGSWLATAGTDGTARIWDAAAGEPRATLTGPTGRVMAVAIAPDGSWLATAGNDGTMWIWDAAAGQIADHPTGHTDRDDDGGDRAGRQLAGYRPAATRRRGSGTHLPEPRATLTNHRSG